MKKAIILFNLGGPNKLDDVKQAHIDIESRKIVGPAVIIP